MPASDVVHGAPPEPVAARAAARASVPAWFAIVLVALLGVLDGGLRARFRLPTILGESVSYDAGVDVLGAGFPQPHGGARSLLMQQFVGGTCTHAWNCDEGLVCREGVCETCETDSECTVRNDKERCFNTTVGDAPKCKHKLLFSPFGHSDTLIAIITFVTIMLAAPSGIGGGGILVPMYLAIGKFSPRHGIPLSKATIFGGAVTNNWFNVQKRHPDCNRPMIDYNLCMIMEPVLLLGTIIGVFFNAVSPGWLITILLVLTLTYTTYRTTMKAFETYEKEVKAEREEEEQQLLPDGDNKKKHISYTPELAAPGLREIYEEESRVNWTSIAVLCIAWVIIAVFSILKGGEGGQGIAECGTLLYWALVAAPVPLVALLVWKMGNNLADRHEEKERLGFEFVEGDLMWTRRNVRIYPLYTITAGFAAGSLGIAAGTILGPILLEMGLVPIVGTSSSGFMVIFTASSTTFQFLVMGQLQVRQNRPAASKRNPHHPKETRIIHNRAIQVWKNELLTHDAAGGLRGIFLRDWLHRGGDRQHGGWIFRQEIQEDVVCGRAAVGGVGALHRAHGVCGLRAGHGWSCPRQEPGLPRRRWLPRAPPPLPSVLPQLFAVW